MIIMESTKHRPERKQDLITFWWTWLDKTDMNVASMFVTTVWLL